MHTFGNLIHSNFRIPTEDYRQLLEVTRVLTRNHQDVLGQSWSGRWLRAQLEVTLADDLQVMQLVAGDVVRRGTDAHRITVGEP